MHNKKLKIALIVCSLLLVAELIFLGVMHFIQPEDVSLSSLPTDTTSEPLPEETDSQPTDTNVTGETALSTEETDPSEETEPTETEPTQQRYVLTFVGDCTLASSPDKYNTAGGFIKTIGEDYSYPFRNIVEYFENDDFTMINLESVLADSGNAAGGKTFTFKGPTAYTQILTGSSVEAVTLANNHTEDYGKDGYASTKAALEEAGVSYVEKDNTMLFTTESGLTIGVYAAAFDINVSDMKSDIAKLRSQGAEIVVAALHWGSEGQYRPTSDQQNKGHAAIDAGADIVYGHHPHVLQKIEEYNGGIIYYSLGNFCFGGNHFPRDMDSVIVQQEVIRDEDGNISLGEMTLIPISISSMKNQNNFQPTPYEEGSDEYVRTLSKLDGTFTGPDLVVDYSFLDPTDPTESTGSTQPTEGGQTGGETGGDTSGDTFGDTSGDTGGSTGGDTGGDSSGDPAGDSGGNTGGDGDSGAAEG